MIIVGVIENSVQHNRVEWQKRWERM